MSFSIGFVGAGQFADGFARLFKRHPAVDRVFATDVSPERAQAIVDNFGLDGAFASFEELLASDVDAVAIFTQRWNHGPLAAQALEAGKHVYSAVPMAMTEAEVEKIVALVAQTGLVYMMGETSYYNPATVFARERRDEIGRVIYAEGEYLHDMELGFYDAYRYSGGEQWKQTASYPPMLYATHSVGGVLGGLATHAVSVSCLGVVDDRDDGVFDREVSLFDNDFSNASALFELADGGVMRINEMRRVGYPSLKETRYSFFGTEGSLEQTALTSVWETKQGAEDVTDLLEARPSMDVNDPSLAHVSEALRAAFVSGHAPIHDVSRLPREFAGEGNGHEGSHQFLVDDFARAVEGNLLPPVNAWVAARFTLPGIAAHQSAQQGGARIAVRDLGEPPR